MTTSTTYSSSIPGVSQTPSVQSNTPPSAKTKFKVFVKKTVDEGTSKVKQGIHLAEDTLKKLNLLNKLVLSPFRQVVGFVNAIDPVPPGLSNVAQSLKVMSFVGGILKLKTFAVSAVNIVISDSLKERIQAAWDALDSGVGVVGSAASCAGFLAHVKAVSKAAVSWTGLVATILFPIEAVLYLKDSYDFIKTNIKCFKAFSNVKIKIEKDQNPTQASLRAMEYIIRKEERSHSLSKRVNLAKDAGLLEKAQSIQAKLNSADKATIDEGNQEAKELVSLLKGRIAHKIASESLKMLAATVQLVGSIVLIAAAKAFPVGLGLIAGSSVLSVAQYFYTKFALEPRPFTEMKKLPWDEKVVRYIKTAPSKLYRKVKQGVTTVVHNWAQKPQFATI